jgi:predicted TIM-barrel fold metal-dependent hydrolase
MNIKGNGGASSSARVRAQLDHPVIDCDGHWFEPMPIFLEFLRDAGGAKMVDAFRAQKLATGRWYERTPEERYAWRQSRPPAWSEQSANTLDRATADLPALLYERLDELGIDFAVIYPSIGLGSIRIPQQDLRQAWIRAANQMSAELFAPYKDRLTPVAAVPTETPEEAVEELEYVRKTLGMKAIFINGNIRRPIPALAASPSPGSGAVPFYLDPLGLDSPHDYDRLWAAAVEHHVAITLHGGSMGWPDRTSPSNFVYNHVGHFAAAGHTAAKALFLGGVTQRFPDLHFAFLEGGVSWACQLLFDLLGHWRKRNSTAMLRNLCPTLTDFDQLRALYDQYGGERWKGRFDEVVASPSRVDPYKSVAELVAQEPTEGAMSYDDFAALEAEDEEALKGLFRDRFWFGCEADDPGASWAFSKQLDLRLKPVFSSDIGHFDVTNMAEVLQEAYELVDRGLLDEEDFKRFTFTNAAALHGGMDPHFFDGTVVEEAVSRSATILS